MHYLITMEQKSCNFVNNFFKERILFCLKKLNKFAADEIFAAVRMKGVKIARISFILNLNFLKIIRFTNLFSCKYCRLCSDYQLKPIQNMSQKKCMFRNNCG